MATLGSEREHLVVSSTRIAGAVGGAALAGAGLLLSGRANGSIVTVLVLIASARAAATVLEPVLGPRTLSAHVALVPAWVGLVVVGAARAGSPLLEDVRGANAVAGLAVGHGSAAMVAAVWLALVAAVGATAASVRRTSLGSAGARLDVVAVALQIVLVVTLFAGPHVRTLGDVTVWTGASVVGAGLVALARRLPVGIVRLGANACALGALVIVLSGART